MTGKIAAQLRNISKQYPGSKKKANNNINLDIYEGELLSIAGENGAGKTTLMKILYGLEKPDSGEILINGRKENISSPLAATKLGIGMVHQHFMLFDDYTVAENIVMGIEPAVLGVFFDKKKALEETDKIINEHNFSINSAQKVKDISLGQKQQVEICRLLHRNANIIILDEPTSILTDHETASLYKTLKNLVKLGKSVILITHKINEIKNNCSRLAVLRNGEMACLREADGIDENEIASMIMGEQIPPLINKGQTKEKEKITKKAVIRFDNVTVRRKGQKIPLLDSVSFAVNGGEILGFAGVGGNGLGVIEAVLGGFLHPAQGKIFHRDKDISSLNIRTLREEGLAYVPADRLNVGSAGDASIEENIIINRRHDFMKKNIINKKETKEYLKSLSLCFNIEGADGDKKCSTLSGGNLQKLILAREIDCYKDYIVFSQPTWGLDIASANYVMGEIFKLREKGAAVILISTNLDEIISLADRVNVMYRGKIAGEFNNTKDEVTKEMMSRCMQGLMGAV
jgi:simple sugar transport system ATP-binding protein